MLLVMPLELQRKNINHFLWYSLLFPVEVSGRSLMGNWGNTRPALPVFVLKKLREEKSWPSHTNPLGGPRGEEKSVYV